MTDKANDPIYRLWNFGFGDHWASMSWLRHVAKATRRRPSLSYIQHGTDFSHRLHEIDQALAMDGDGPIDYTPMLTNGQPTQELDGFDVWSCPVVPTKLRWEFDPQSRLVVYQFDGASSPDKNPSVADSDRILRHLRGQGYMTFVLGKHLSVAECVRACSRAAMFVGCCSGMSHLAHSVGVPVYLLEYGLPVITCHRQKQFVICKGADHFIGESQNYLKLTAKLRGLSAA